MLRRTLMGSGAAAAAAGKAARDYAMAHFSLARFLREWNDVIDEMCE